MTEQTTTVETEKQSPESAFALKRQDNGVAILTMDVPGESMNTLKSEFGDQINAMLDEIDNDKSIKGVVLASGKKKSFVAGADISMLAKCENAADAQKLATNGQDVFNRITKRLDQNRNDLSADINSYFIK